ncbi:putative uncharacterized protein DDB_G0271606 [Ceratitis capitata]|uniref:putative uncharacterized protein DDB_G0271606 n=1 Tax=Ceratitis capitata TaxID=7213 RepID=UPI000329F3A5|nr:putative uncharacterized protein DDB_G0271606 [Ceratitis capitata]
MASFNYPHAATRKVATLGLLIACLLHASLAQLSFHTDANSNSFTLKTPALQQSFSRVFGGQQQLQQQQLQQQQRQQVTPSYAQQPQQLQQFAQPLAQPQLQQQQQYQQPLQQQQQFTQRQQFPQFSQYSNAAEAPSPYQQQAVQYSQPSYPYSAQYATTPATPTYAQDHYAQTLQQIQQQQQLQQQQLLQAQQPQYASTPKSVLPQQVDQVQAAYLAYQQQQQQQQQQELQQQQQQQQQQYAAQQNYQQQLLRQLYQEHRPTAPAYTAGSNNHIYTSTDYANYMQRQQQLAERQYGSAPTAATYASDNGLGSSSTTPISPTGSSTTEKLLGIQYSPSDQVSHVKFSSGNLKYNF